MRSFQLAKVPSNRVMNIRRIYITAKSTELFYENVEAQRA